MRPGEIVVGSEARPQTGPARRARVTARNTGELPVYIGSHFDLTRLSETLELDRATLSGARLDVPAGTTARIAPGETVELELIWD